MGQKLTHICKHTNGASMFYNLGVSSPNLSLSRLPPSPFRGI